MRQHMSTAERAKQFMSFSALKGYEEAIAAKEFRKKERILLGEDAQAELDRKLRALKTGDSIELSFYTGEDYAELAGVIHKIDPVNKLLTIGGREIKIEDIYDIK